MNKTIYRIMGIIVAFTLALGGFTKAEAISVQPAGTSKPVYVYYYLWWSSNHWKSKLGPNYPYSASQLPLPAKTDLNGCNSVSKYAGNHLLDVPGKLFDQDDPGIIEYDIKLAKNAGITGFWLNWSGTGTTTQTRTSVPYTPRLAEAFAASTRVGGFKNWVSYKAASSQSADYIINDLNFLYKSFNTQPAWERINNKPVVTFTGSRKYSDADVLKISQAVRDRIFLVGDESYRTLTSARIAMFDAITYYWSSQDPYLNPQSFDQIKAMGRKVHAAGKRWYAPLAPGYNSQLLNGDGNCVPRKDGATIRKLWNGNLASNPDGWGFISWNEIAENTHIRPMRKWGRTYLDVLSGLIAATQ
jgi:Glycosyl hydrolase family 71